MTREPMTGGESGALALIAVGGLVVVGLWLGGAAAAWWAGLGWPYAGLSAGWRAVITPSKRDAVWGQPMPTGTRYGVPVALTVIACWSPPGCCGGWCGGCSPGRPVPV